MTENKDGSKTIVVDKELLEILDILMDNIKKVAYEGIEKISYKQLTKVLARKIKVAKLILKT